MWILPTVTSAWRREVALSVFNAQLDPRSDTVPPDRERAPLDRCSRDRITFLPGGARGEVGLSVMSNPSPVYP
jgi:hypothetical protein